MLTQRPLLLSGFMGAGKSTIGPIVAALAGAAFVDLDAVIEAREGASISAIFATRGEAAFRALEAQALAEALAEEGARVVALGGGTLLDSARRRWALERACVVNLTADPTTLVARAGPGRPLLDGTGDRARRAAELLEARAAAYAEAHARIDTSKRAPDEIARDVLAAWREPRVAVALGERSYAVRFVADAEDAVAASVAQLMPTRVLLVTDERVGPLWAAPLEKALAAAGAPAAATIVLRSGEAHKTLTEVSRAFSEMVAGGADRGSVVVALGGGVVTDMAGFAAATLFRGVRWVAVPTTLLAMVDASVGGKTGVDLGAAKNAVGAFHQPSAVLVGASYVRTQSPRDYASGLAEIIKAALIADSDLLDLLEHETDAIVARDPALVMEVAHRAVAVKASIVARDEREAGDRALLNFGHTLGHALEAQGGFARETHGEAVGLGMVAALRVGVARGVTDPSLPSRLVALLDRFALPSRLDPARVAAAVGLLALDKKRLGSQVRAVFVRKSGEAVVERVPLAELASAFIDAANFAAVPKAPLD